MSAVISECGLYRYWLERDLGQSGPTAAFVMLNPSTADAEQDDPTIRRCIGYARSWGCDRLVVVNLFAYRATNPGELSAPGTKDPVGPSNDDWIRRAAERVWDCAGEHGPLVCAWGTRGTLMGRGDAVRGILEATSARPSILRLTKGGHPSHPLYLPKTLQPEAWLR